MQRGRLLWLAFFHSVSPWRAARWPCDSSLLPYCWAGFPGADGPLACQLPVEGHLNISLGLINKAALNIHIQIVAEAQVFISSVTNAWCVWGIFTCLVLWGTATVFLKDRAIHSSAKGIQVPALTPVFGFVVVSKVTLAIGLSQAEALACIFLMVMTLNIPPCAPSLGLCVFLSELCFCVLPIFWSDRLFFYLESSSYSLDN